MIVNARILLAPLTGAHRYLREVLDAWPGEAPELRQPPAFAANGIAAHAWEQLILPRHLGGELLWSPVHSGPVSVAHQVVTVHDLVPLDHPEWVSPRFARWYRWMLPRLVRRARHVIAISGFTRDRMLALTGIPAHRVSVIPLGVSARFAPAASDQVVAMRRALGLADRRYLLSLCSLEPRKNLPRPIEGWQRALPKLPRDLWLVIAGAPGRRSTFGRAHRIGDADRVILTGRVEDRLLPALYSGTEWFVYLSLYEGFGLPPLEAMACGTPVLASDIEVFREVSGEAALRVASRDPNAIATALERIAGDSGLRAEQAGRARAVAARYTWTATATATAELLRRYA